VPAEQALRCERRFEIPCGIEHHLDDAFDFSSWLRQARDIEPELASDRRTDLFGVEVLPFDGRGLHDFIRERGEAGVYAKLETQGLHLPEVPALLVAHGCKGACQGPAIPGELWPARPLVNKCHFHRTYCGDYMLQSPHSQVFTATCAENRGRNRRQVDANDRRRPKIGLPQFPPLLIETARFDRFGRKNSMKSGHASPCQRGPHAGRGAA